MLPSHPLLAPSLLPARPLLLAARLHHACLSHSRHSAAILPHAASVGPAVLLPAVVAAVGAVRLRLLRLHAAVLVVQHRHPANIQNSLFDLL